MSLDSSDTNNNVWRWCINNGKAKNPLPPKTQGATVPIRAEMGIPRAVMIFMAAMRT